MPLTKSLGYWVQGFRCFAWLGLNFHMAHNLNYHPSTLQLVQNFGNLPLLAKPLFGILSDAIYIGCAHRIPYISIGASNQTLELKTIWQSIKKHYYDLMEAIRKDSICLPLSWLVASIAMVPVFSGSIFCYQTKCLNLDPSIIGMSKVTSQLMLLSVTVLYDRSRKSIPMRKLSATMQVLYGSSLLLDLVLVKQPNLKLGIPNEVFALCFGVWQKLSHNLSSCHSKCSSLVWLPQVVKDLSCLS
ncbi:hypothetical protein RJ639_044241 [Escallonia herrerae]|uniref:Uncharacterized protein n=1 Tax=Escallonia herrerae TaxID=1293975 RepID=A0AA89B164_9ASTE|nr:hypothetical protein RJ639_044241 [Escallonia herrerae]